MKFTATALAVASLLSVATAQNATAANYTQGLVSALNSAGLTTLATVLGGYPSLTAQLQKGNYTVSQFLILFFKSRRRWS